MKYFTPELIQRIQADNFDVYLKAYHEWEQAIVRSERRWKRIRPSFPKEVQRFNDERVCLHDARLWSMGRDGETLLMVLEPEPPAQTLVFLTFTLNGEPIIDRKALPGRKEHDWVEWMYEEWDVDRQKRCWFEVLLSNGWSVKLCFRDFHYRIAQRLFPVPKPPAEVMTPPPQSSLPQTA